MKMAASRMSRIADCRLALLSLLVLTTLAPVLSSSDVANTPEGVEDAEMIPGHVVLTGADSDVTASASSFDLKKHNSNNKKFQKFYPKTEADWNFKGEGKKTDVYIKDPKDNRLLRLITEGLIGPQDILPVVSNDAIISSQKNVSNEEIKMSVTVQPEGISGILDDGLAADSAEKIIIEKKKNATKEKFHHKPEIDASRESDENVKINLDGNAGVQSPVFTNHKDSIAVPAQKHISLSKGKESHVHKRLNDGTSFDVIPLNKLKDTSKQQTVDDGVFDFIDTPLSNKNLVPAGTAQTSRINVKKGPNGQDYEYEYVYYYYEDPDEASNLNSNKQTKSNEIPVSSSTPPARTTTPVPRHSPSPTTRFTKTYDDNLGTRIKPTDILNEPALSQSQSSRDKFNVRPDFRYTVDNAASPFPTAPNKPVISNEVSWAYDQNSRFPGRQIPPQSASEQPRSTVVEEALSTTRQPARGRFHHNTIPPTTMDDSSFIVTALPPSTVTPTHSRGRSGANVRQPGLDLVDSNSFRTHSTRIPSDYEQYQTQTFDNPIGKSLKQNSESTISQNLPPIPSSTKGDFQRTKESTIDYTGGTERFPSTQPPRFVSISTEINNENTAPLSTLPEGTLTTVYGAGLTDKAAHDLYAIYQQTQNEETVRNTIAQDDRTTIIDEPEINSFATNLPTTTSYIPPTTTTPSTTTAAPTTTTTTTTTPVPPVVLPGRGRFRGSSPRIRHTTTTTESASLDATSEATERTRSKFQPQQRREPGHRVSAYGRRGSSTTASPDAEVSSSNSNSVESSTRHSYSPSRNRYRGSGNLRSENSTPENSVTPAPSQHSKPNFSDRFNSRRRPGLRTSTTSTLSPSPSEDEDSVVRQEVSSEANSIDPQPSTTYRSTRNKFHQNPQVRPLRPGAKINFNTRGRLGVTSSTTPATVPLDADTSGSVDIPIEQRHPEENAENDQEVPSDFVSNSTPPPIVSTVQPDSLHRLKNRPKLRIGEKSNHVKFPTQQSNNTVALHQNRKQLVGNLLPRKKHPITSTENPEPKEEKAESGSRPVSEDFVEDAPQKADTDTSDLQPIAEVSTTTENKLSFLLASRRRNFSRKPGTLVHPNRQTANEES